MPRYDEHDYRRATPILPRDYRDGDSLKSGLLNGSVQTGQLVESELMRTYLKDQEAKPDGPGGLPPLSRDQKMKWFLIMFLSLVMTIGYNLPGPLMIYLQSAYFNDGKPCITRNQTDSPGCKEALSTLAFVSGWFQALSGLLSFILSPVIGKLSDTYGRRRILILCYAYSSLSNITLFLGQTPLMSHLPWLWIYYSLNVVNLWGGVGNAYLADIMPPEWRSIAFGIGASIYGIGKVVGPAIDLIPWPGSSASNINYLMPFGITASCNVFAFLVALFFLKETLPPELRVPFKTETFNTIKQSGILWRGPTGISDNRFFRRLAFTVFVQGIGMDGCFLVIGFYIKQQFAISKDQNTWIMEIQGVTAIFVMWVLFKPLIVNLGERRVIILGLLVNFCFFLGYLYIVPAVNPKDGMSWVYFFTYALTTGKKGIAFMKAHLGFVISEKWVWYLGGSMMFTAVCVATSLPDPRDIYVPGADENLSITNSEIARRIRCSPELQGKPESVITAAINEALENQRKQRTKEGAGAIMKDYRRGGAVETVMSPLEPENTGGALSHLALHPYTIIPGMQGSMQADYRRSVTHQERPASLGHFMPITARYQRTSDGGFEVDILQSKYHEKFPGEKPLDPSFFAALEWHQA